MQPFTRWLSASLLLTSFHLSAGEVRIAVASNFSEPLKQLAEQFEAESGHHLLISSGSTGKQYAQIVNGAPFDLFFAADRRRPELLEQQGYGQPGSRFSYALGRLVLWSPQAGRVDSQGDVLKQAEFAHLAVANPKLAPYGRAAREVLEKLDLWKPLRSKLIRGENIGQTYRFVQSGSAELGFVAYSQVKRSGERRQGSLWEIPESLYSPIEQQAIQLTNNGIATQFLHFLHSDEARLLIRDFGYRTPR